jgi:hypothetical protein
MYWKSHRSPAVLLANFLKKNFLNSVLRYCFIGGYYVVFGAAMRRANPHSA